MSRRSPRLLIMCSVPVATGAPASR